MTTPSAGGPPAGPVVAAPETPEAIAAKLVHGGPPYVCTEAEYNGPDYTCNSCDEVVAALLRRGEEERARALRCSDCGAPLESYCGSRECVDRALAFHTDACVSIWPSTDPACPCAAAPSGDAKAAAPDSEKEG